jgi:Asp-tRNA(Asn)/Glu-tRNA(Gln) amidotransferase A subunit family amidase
MDLVLLSASELRRLSDAGRVSAKEVASACIERIKAVDPLVQSFVTLVDEERVMAAAD